MAISSFQSKFTKLTCENFLKFYEISRTSYWHNFPIDKNKTII